MLHAVFVRSHARTECRSIDTTAAAAVPGVELVLTGADLDGVVAPLAPPETGGLHAPAHSALVSDRVRFVGDPLALVVAVSRAVAEDAAELLDVDIEPLRALPSVEAAPKPTFDRGAAAM
jgi:carbon-monoxide dehydrogenase large subunit